MVDMLEKVVKSNPGTIFVTCHLANCCYYLNKLCRLLDTYSNLYADISARFEEIAIIPRFASSFFTKYQDKLLYGTDNGFNRDIYWATFRIYETNDEHFYIPSLSSYHWLNYGLGLDGVTLKKIYR